MILNQFYIRNEIPSHFPRQYPCQCVKVHQRECSPGDNAKMPVSLVDKHVHHPPQKKGCRQKRGHTPPPETSAHQ